MSGTRDPSWPSTLSCGSTPGSRSTSATRTHPGSAAATRTPMACCANTSRREPTCPVTPSATWPRSPSPSTADPERPWTGRPQPRPSISYSPFHKLVLHRLLEPKQYLSITYTERLASAGIEASVGTVGDSYDNAAAEAVNRLYKKELIWPQGPWTGLDAVEYATLEWVDWYNNRRLHSWCHDQPPAEHETTLTGHTGNVEA